LPVVYDQDALRDLATRQNWIEERASAKTAVAYTARVQAACDAIGWAPTQGRLIEEIDPGLRVIGFERRHNIYFKVADGKVRVLRVLFHGRDASSAFRKR
jgi:plasmid stabilization system protein ParE